jgi:colicin import membrane protein
MSETETEVVVNPSEVVHYKTTLGDIERAEKMEAGISFNYADKKGNAEARSHVFGLRKIKGSIERSRKAAKEGLLEMGRQIDSQAKAMESRVETLIQRHEVPLLEIENKEKERKAALQMRVDAIAAYGVNRAGEILSGAITAERLRKGAQALSAIVIDATFEERQEDAQIAKANSAAYLEQAIIQAQAEEDKRAEAKRQAAELESMRREKAERDAKAAEDARVAAATAEAARKVQEAEEARRVAEQAAKDAEIARLQAVVKAQQEAEAAKSAAEEKARQDAILAAQKAEADRLAAEQAAEAARVKAEADKVAAVASERARYEAEVAKAEAQRQADELKAQIEREAKERDEENRARIQSEIAESIVAAIEWHGVENTILCESVAIAIMAGKIRHVKVEF